MDFISPEIPVEIEQYLHQYDDLFKRSEQRRHLRYYVAGLLSETHRKNIFSIAAKVIKGNYQSLHHFLTDAPWSRQQVNIRRLQLIQQDPTTRMSKHGWWIQDDTGQERRYWKPESGRYGTDGVARQYIGNVGKVSQGLVFVSTLYADLDKQFGIVSDLFWPEAARKKLPAHEQTMQRCRDKIDIALDQLRWINQNISEPKPNRVLVDSWYGSNPRYLKTIGQELRWKYIACIRSNVKLFVPLPGERGHPEHHVREITMTLLKTKDFQPVFVLRADGRKETKWAAELRDVKIKHIGYTAHLVIQVDDPYQINPDEATYMLCNDEDMKLAEIVQAKTLRNEVEVFYEDSKDDLGLDQAEVRSEEGLLRHWTLVMLVHTMIETFRCRGDLSKWMRKSLKTRGDVLRAIRDIFRWGLYMLWMKDEKNAEEFIQWFCTSRGLNVDYKTLITATT